MQINPALLINDVKAGVQFCLSFLDVKKKKVIHVMEKHPSMCFGFFHAVLSPRMFSSIFYLPRGVKASGNLASFIYVMYYSSYQFHCVLECFFFFIQGSLQHVGLHRSRWMKMLLLIFNHVKIHLSCTSITAVQRWPHV